MFCFEVSYLFCEDCLTFGAVSVIPDETCDTFSRSETPSQTFCCDLYLRAKIIFCVDNIDHSVLPRGHKSAKGNSSLIEDCCYGSQVPIASRETDFIDSC